MGKKGNRDIMRQIRYNSKRGLSPLEMLVIQESAKKHTKEMKADAALDATIMMLAIPLNVLVHDYWSKTAKKRAKSFVMECVKLMDAVSDGTVTVDELNDLLEEYASIRVTSEGVVTVDGVAKPKKSQTVN